MGLLGLMVISARWLPGIAGQIALYPALGVFPGMAAAALLAGRARSAPRWTLGLTISPLVSATAGVLLLKAGLAPASAVLAIASAGFALWALAALLLPGIETQDQDPEPAPDLRFVLGWAILLAVLAALPWLLNPFIRVRIDSWLHAGLVWDILQHGLPPEDPRFAGLPLYYVWFFNLFIALLTVLGSNDPFVNMDVFNTLNIAVCVSLAYRIGLTLWRDRTAAMGSALLLTLGLNAGTWVLWPMRLARALTGDVRGMPEVRSAFQEIHWGDAEIIYSLPAPFSHMVSFIDKFTIGTALSYGWLMMLLYLWAMLRWLGEGRREALAWALVSAAGMLFIHGVVGMSVLPVALGTLGLAWLASFRWNGLPSRGRLVGLAAVTLAGALLAAPYTRSISSGWAHDRSGIENQYLRPGFTMIWTLLTSCAVAAWFARRPLARLWREPSPEGRVLVIFTAAMTVFACIVHLPLDNESKFIFEVFFPLALIGGAAFVPETRAFLARHRVWGAPALVLLYLTAPLLTLYGYSVDPARDTRPELNPAPGEEALHAWIRSSTDPSAVFVDDGGRDLLMVLGRRRLWVGTTAGPDKAGFPGEELDFRRVVTADLYGPGVALDRDADALRRLGRPIYVLVRPGAPTPALAGRPDRFERVYDRDGFVVFRLRS